MFPDRAFKIALTISLVVHAASFLKLPRLNFLRSLRRSDKVEVTYIKEKIVVPTLESYKEKLPKNSSYQSSSRRIAPPPYVKKEKIFVAPKGIPISKPDFVKPEIIAVKRRITLPLLNDKKINNPVYLNYYQIVREKIKDAAYQNYTRLVNGEVYLSFIILRDGQLTNVRINEVKSTARTYLKQIAKRSVKAASPFPSFPKDLNYPQLSFNVIISFQAE